MSMTKPIARDGATDWRHIAPFAALFALMLVWALGGLFVIAREADRSDAARAREAVGRTFDAMLKRMENAALINAAVSDNAVHLAEPVLDRNAIVKDYNFGSPDAIGYYGVIVFAPDGRPVIGTYAGRDWTGPAYEAAARLAAPLARALPVTGIHSVHVLVRDGAGQPVVLAASNITPPEDEVSPAITALGYTPRPRLVMLQPVQRLLPKIAPAIGAEGFRIAAREPDARDRPNSIDFPVEHGRPLTFVWRPRSPGQAAVVRWLPAMLVALALASVLLGVAVRRSLAATSALRDLAERDQLTGLPNRACLLGELDRRLARTPTLALGLMDLNGFKAVNDTHGHLAGDDVLRAFAAEASGATARGEMIARLGGDEFAYLGATLADAERFAAELRERLVRPLDVGGLRLRIGSGIGIAVARPGIAARDLIALADARLYRDKAERARAEGPPARIERTALTMVG